MTTTITIDGGMALLEDGSVVDLLAIQALLNSVFQDTGDHAFMAASDELSRITNKFQGPHGDWEDIP